MWGKNFLQEVLPPHPFFKNIRSEWGRTGCFHGGLCRGFSAENAPFVHYGTIVCGLQSVFDK
jgi:hypothetical protein